VGVIVEALAVDDVSEYLKVKRDSGPDQLSERQQQRNQHGYHRETEPIRHCVQVQRRERVRIFQQARFSVPRSVKWFVDARAEVLAPTTKRIEPALASRGQNQPRLSCSDKPSTIGG
jgi:hypothetical protein